MGWLIELIVQVVADLFGHAVGRRRAWWVELVAALGCMLVLGVVVFVLWLMLFR